MATQKLSLQNEINKTDAQGATVFCGKNDNSPITLEEIKILMGEEADQYTDEELRQILEYFTSTARVFVSRPNERG